MRRGYVSDGGVRTLIFLLRQRAHASCSLRRRRAGGWPLEEEGPLGSSMSCSSFFRFFVGTLTGGGWYGCGAKGGSC